MNIYLQIITLVASIIVGGLLVSIFKKPSHLKLLLSFSGGFLLTLIFIHILPESYETIEVTGYFILIGFLLQLALEYFSGGAEHGHTHVHHDHSENKKIFPVAIFLSLSIHAFLETMPLNAGDHDHMEHLYWGIILHKIPVGVALLSILKASGYSTRSAWIYLVVFALIAPTGLIFGGLIVESAVIELNYLLAIVVGMLIHISTTIIFESSESHRINILKLTAIIFGFGVAALIGA